MQLEAHCCIEENELLSTIKTSGYCEQLTTTSQTFLPRFWEIPSQLTATDSNTVTRKPEAKKAQKAFWEQKKIIIKNPPLLRKFPFCSTIFVWILVIDPFLKEWKYHVGCAEWQPSGTEGIMLNPERQREELGKIDSLKLFNSSDCLSWDKFERPGH